MLLVEEIAASDLMLQLLHAFDGLGFLSDF